MKKTKLKKRKIEKLIQLYEHYKSLKKTSDFVPKKQLPPLTLDEQIENINPYYVRDNVIRYG